LALSGKSTGRSKYRGRRKLSFGQSRGDREAVIRSYQSIADRFDIGTPELGPTGDEGLVFPDPNHAIKRDPRTGLRSADNNWDFWTLLPEALHQVTIVMSDRGLPRSFRHMHGFGSPPSR
jgi:hypothetical protein